MSFAGLIGSVGYTMQYLASGQRYDDAVSVNGVIYDCKNVSDNAISKNEWVYIVNTLGETLWVSDKTPEYILKQLRYQRYGVLIDEPSWVLGTYTSISASSTETCLSQDISTGKVGSIYAYSMYAIGVADWSVILDVGGDQIDQIYVAENAVAYTKVRSYISPVVDDIAAGTTVKIEATTAVGESGNFNGKVLLRETDA